MRVPRIFSSQPLHENTLITLDEPAAHHVSRVLRMQEGRSLILFNGKGGEFSAEITDVRKKQVVVKTTSFIAENRESPLKIELAIAISRGERMDWVFQKATELGVSRITPLLTERTEFRLNEDRQDKKLAHWHQIIISACEQCQRNILPQLNVPVSLNNWLPTAAADLKLVLHHRDNKSLPHPSSPQSVILLIGPEGGLSEQEITMAGQKGFTPLTLGPRVLRTETAPITAISLAQYLWGDL